jgi:multidrug resistance efflux pump
MKKIPTFLVTVLVLGLLLSACGNKTSAPTAVVPATSTNVLIAEGHLVPNRSQYMTFQAGGKVAEILVKKGDQAKQGQVLVNLGDREPVYASWAAAQLAMTSAQQAFDSLNRTADLGRAQAWQAYMDAQKKLAEAQLAWDQLDQSAIQTDIDNAQSEVTSRKSDLEDAQKDFNKYADLSNENATRKDYEQKLRTAQTDYDKAVQKLEDLTNARDRVHAALLAAQNIETEARRTYDNTQNGPDSDKLVLAQAQLDNAKAQVAAVKNTLDAYELKAPFDCTIMDTNVTENQVVGPGTWVVAVADTSRWYVDTTDLGELDVVKVSVGQMVDITADALPGVKMSGAVEEIGQAPKSQGTDVLYIVHIRLDDPDPLLRWGMTMEVTFTTQK